MNSSCYYSLVKYTLPILQVDQYYIYSAATLECSMVVILRQILWFYEYLLLSSCYIVGIALCAAYIRIITIPVL